MLGLELSLLFLLCAVLATDESARKMLSYLVGGTAGLQVAFKQVHLFTFAVILFVIFDRNPVGRRGRGSTAVVIVLAAVPLAVTVLTGALVNNKTTAIQLMLLAGCATLCAWRPTRADITKMLTGLLAVVTAASVAGILQYVHILPLVLFNGTTRPTGFYAEPDWLGLYAALGVVLAYRTVKSVRIMMLLVLVNTAGLLLSAARAGIIALGICVLLSLIGRNHGSAKRILAATAAVAVLLIAVPSLGSTVTERFQGALGQTKDVSTLARQQQNAALAVLSNEAPWYGLGLTASGRVQVSGRLELSGQSTNNVASNWIYGWWIDGRVLAVPLIGLFLFVALKRRNSVEGQLLVLVLVNSLVSDAILEPISWFLLGVAVWSNPVRSRARRPKRELSSQRSPSRRAASVTAAP